MNAVKTGLMGRTVLLPGEDVAAYLAGVENRHKPTAEAENMLVQSIAVPNGLADCVIGVAALEALRRQLSRS